MMCNLPVCQLQVVLGIVESISGINSVELIIAEFCHF